MAISPNLFFRNLIEKDIDFFTGVPDSLLKEFCLCLNANVLQNHHIIAANEGNAIALAAGYHLATGKLALVYMQNSGLGNAANPLLSLCDAQIYSIPMLLLIGWRGEPGVKDEPQHVKQGQVQNDLLRVLDIPFEVVSKGDDEGQIIRKLEGSIDIAEKGNRPSGIVVKKGTFHKFDHAFPGTLPITQIKRETALECILKHIEPDSVIVSTTGKTSREIFEIREKNGQQHCREFLTVGSMGHCSSIALGICIGRPNRRVICVDGDGALIMHLGSLATIGKVKPKNFYHILINNFVHESVGGQETAARYMDISQLAMSCGYKSIFSVKSEEELKNSLKELMAQEGPGFLEVRVKSGSRDDLGRPSIGPVENKIAFMEYLRRKGA